jgi:hypothetical protein
MDVSNLQGRVCGSPVLDLGKYNTWGCQTFRGLCGSIVLVFMGGDSTQICQTFIGSFIGVDLLYWIWVDIKHGCVTPSGTHVDLLFWISFNSAVLKQWTPSLL